MKFENEKKTATAIVEQEFFGVEIRCATDVLGYIAFREQLIYIKKRILHSLTFSAGRTLYFLFGLMNHIINRYYRIRVTERFF